MQESQTTHSWIEKYSVPFGRIALFVIFFWFGLLKVLSLSPANPLVAELEAKTLPFISFDTFILLFGLFEMLIGVLFLIPKATRLVFILFILHMITTFLPLVCLPEVTWQKPFVPTLEGQYIIKNLALISVAFFLLINHSKNHAHA